MKKRLCTLLLALALCLSLFPAASAAGSTTVVLKIGSNQMAVNTAVQQVDTGNAAVVPIIENDRTIVPVSRIVAAFGGSSTWDGPTQGTTFTLNGKTVSHTVGTNVVTTPKGKKTMEASSRIIHDRTYIPVRYVLEGLGLNVGYEPTKQLVVVSTASLSGKDLLTLPGSQALLSAQALNVLPASNYTSGTLVAPARTKADMEPKHADGAYVQDLASATGFTFWRNSSSSSGNIYGYDCDYDLSDEAVLDAVEDYVDLLASQPDFELVHPFSEDDTGAFYFAYLNYTGSAARMKGDLDAMFWDDRTVHVEVYVSLPSGYYTSWDIMVSLDGNLKYEDLGLRTSAGSELSPWQISGDRVGDAYYLDKGTYYNSSDKKLSTTSGKAALLIDGKSYTAQAEFKTGSKDSITLSGYYRSDEITISLPEDWTVTGDVYGLDELRYGRKESRDGAYLRVDYDNGDQWANPLADPDQQVTEATVRVLRWDKSGSGDTVLYFHMKAEIQGKTYDIEGLAAALWTDPDARPSGSSSSSVLDKEDCSACRGSGRCRNCGGTGRVRNSMAGTGKWIEQDCTSCGGSGDCRDCHGTGKRLT